MSRLLTVFGSPLNKNLPRNKKGDGTPLTGVYSITSPSGKMYVGSSSNLKLRRKAHRRLLNEGRHHSLALQRAWDKYEGRLRFNILLLCSVEHLMFYEQRAIDRLRPCYNMCPIAGTRLGAKMSDKGRKNISSALKGNTYARGLKHTERVRQLISELHKGKSKTVEHRAKIAAALRGTPWCLGRKHSEETKEKMRRSALLLWEQRRATCEY